MPRSKAATAASAARGWRISSVLGYLPADRHHYSVSATLDYAYGDFCVMQVARHLGKSREAEALAGRVSHYRNVFDPSVGFMRERNSDGSWLAPFGEFRWGGGFIEGGPWQHSFHVPHDVRVSPVSLAAKPGSSANSMPCSPHRRDSRWADTGLKFTR